MLPFLTAYDPLGGSPGSIDPLGALQSYDALADLLLPGLTTVTTRSRYLSMMCAALDNAETYLSMLPGASGLVQRRKAVEPFERLWALACVAAREAGHDGAADGLRGVTYVEKSYRNFKNKGTNVNCDFPLLKYQARTGAVGTYWTALVGAELVDKDSGALALEGQELAGHFPELPLDSRDKERLADPERAHRVSLSLGEILAWGEDCHLQAASDAERQKLGESVTADDRRECVSRALITMHDAIPDLWQNQHLKKLQTKLSYIPGAVALGLPTVIESIIVTEQFHEAALVVFDTLLWWATIAASRPISELLDDADFRKALDRCRQTALILREFHEKCARSDVRDGIDVLARFSFRVTCCRTDYDIVVELLDRHHRVQSGKMDGGVPKRDWITWDNKALLRPSPRFQRNTRPDLAHGASLTHPYRMESFVYMLRENAVLPGK